MTDTPPEAPAELPKEKPMDLGVYTRPDKGLRTADLIALVLSGLWLAMVAIYFLVFRPQDEEMTQGGYILSMLAVFLPIALIWIGATVLKTAKVMRDESARLQAAIDAMRNAYINQSQSAGMGVKPAVEKKLEEIAAMQKQNEDAIATFATSRDAPLPGAASGPALTTPGIEPGTSQPSLALGTPPARVADPLSVDDFIGALNFPENEDDAEGFRQLRKALSDPDSGRLVRASQDVLTLLSQDGIYMDDLQPDRARPELWRQFAAGERGRTIAGLGGIRDRSSLALSAGRMRSDPVFRDAVHHFLRQFDKTFSRFAEAAADGDIIRLANTRTSRAFMLLARVTGTFD